MLAYLIHNEISEMKSSGFNKNWKLFKEDGVSLVQNRWGSLFILWQLSRNLFLQFSHGTILPIMPSGLEPRCKENYTCKTGRNLNKRINE